jgi:DNA helicase-2/ATP-dependent DNA helicase PcrA
MTKEFEPTNEQWKIIRHRDEPLRVAAGAGTGKTTTIVERIGYLVDSGLDPSRVLGVTFTNKAADELNSRVLRSIGDDTADRVPEISTYHGFAAAILDEFGAYAGYDRAAMLMDDGHRTELASRVLRAIDTPDLDLTSLPSRRAEMLALAGSLTENLLDADAARRAAPGGIGDGDIDDADEPTRSWRKRLALLDAAETFEAEKRRLGLVEYGDLIRLAVQVVEDSPDVARDISGRYDAVVLDEYQDTDPAQRRLLTGLFSGGVPVTAVGDTDQTIYEWRGASAENFAAFPLDFPLPDGDPAPTLPLSENRRSDTIILDLANRIRDEIPHVDGAKALTPVSGANQGELITSWFDTDRAEAAWLAAQIAASHDEGHAWGDTAILVRNRAHFRPIVEALDKTGIPYTVGSMGELLTVPEVADLLAWLQAIVTPSDDAPLLRILLGGRFRIGMTALAQLRGWSRSKEGSTLFDAVLDADSIAELDPSSLSRIHTFSSLHQELVKKSQVVGVPAIVAAVIESLGYWDEIAALEASASLIAGLNVGRFTDLADQWRPIEGAPTLGGFLRYLAALAESGRADELASETHIQTDAISLLTVHGAKGLEWDHVYLPAVANLVFPGRSHGLDDPDRISKLLPYELRLNQEIHLDVAAAGPKERTEILKGRHLEQEWRLAYVAVTRAAHRLVISGHGWDGSIKNARQPSPLWTMANETPNSRIGVLQPVSESPPPPPVYLERARPPDPLFPAGPAEALRDAVRDSGWIEAEYPDLAISVQERIAQLELMVEDLATPHLEAVPDRFVVSVTNLVTLASCPQKFEWTHHDRLPRRPRASAVRGTAFHRRIELHNLGVLSFDDVDADERDSHVEASSVASEGQRTDPWNIFERSRFSTETPIHIESSFEIEVGAGSIRGKVDAIYESGESAWEIVDYKSGRYRDDSALKVQLEVYALAAADGALSAQPPGDIDVTFAYFGDDELVEITEPVDDAWLHKARVHIETLIDQGENGPFEPTPSDGCRWCDFLHLCPTGQQHVKGSQTI